MGAYNGQLDRYWRWFYTVIAHMGVELMYSRLCSIEVGAPIMSCPFYTQSTSILFLFFTCECLQTTIKPFWRNMEDQVRSEHMGRRPFHRIEKAGIHKRVCVGREYSYSEFADTWRVDLRWVWYWVGYVFKEGEGIVKDLVHCKKYLV